MRGRMGIMPDWYPIIQAAKYLGVPPWDLMEQCDIWRQWAITAMNAEASARKQIQAREE